MEIEGFCKKYIEGYLFCDLKNMNKLNESDLIEINGSKYGACGYPMVMTIISGCELLGRILSDKIKDGAFAYFWNNALLKISRKYKSELANLVYKLARDGLAHTFLTKPGILVFKGSDKHLFQEDGCLIIDARQYFEDFKKAYYEVFCKKLEADDRKIYPGNLNKMLIQYSKKSREILGLPSDNGVSTKGASSLNYKLQEALNSVGSEAVTGAPPFTEDKGLGKAMKDISEYGI